MTDGGTIVTISYYGGEKVMPGYNVMGVCKAALEHSVRYLAWDLGRQKIRVNCISAGPMRTLSAAGIAGFDELREHAVAKIAAGPQRRPQRTRHHRPLSAQRPLLRRDRRDDPRRLRLQHRGAVEVSGQRTGNRGNG